MNEYINELKNRRHELRMNIQFTEIAAENARRLDNDDLADRCNDRLDKLKKELKDLEEVCDKFDI